MRGDYTETHKHYQNLRHHSKREREKEREIEYVSERERVFDAVEWEGWMKNVNIKQSMTATMRKRHY